MNELAEVVVTEGRAYHAGDVVLLRLRHTAPESTIVRILQMLAETRARTGVDFVLLSDEMEVVEPSTSSEANQT